MPHTRWRQIGFIPVLPEGGARHGRRDSGEASAHWLRVAGEHKVDALRLAIGRFRCLSLGAADLGMEKTRSLGLWKRDGCQVLQCLKSGARGEAEWVALLGFLSSGAKWPHSHRETPLTELTPHSPGCLPRPRTRLPSREQARRATRIWVPSHSPCPSRLRPASPLHLPVWPLACGGFPKRIVL